MATETQITKKAELTHDRPVFIPETDIFETENAINVVCNMPAVDQKNIDISLENDVLTITGIQEEENFEGYEFLYQGYDRGIFQRSFTLSEAIDSSNIKASIKQGVLRIELPKSPAAKPKKINVEAIK